MWPMTNTRMKGGTARAHERELGPPGAPSSRALYCRARVLLLSGSGRVRSSVVSIFLFFILEILDLIFLV
jgi:hypothetical protein